MTRYRLAIFTLIAFLLLALGAARITRRLRRPAPVLEGVGPRLTSNQTAEPLALVGRHFFSGMRLYAGPPLNRSFTPTVLDAQHAYLRLPGGLPLPKTDVTTTVALGLEGPGDGAVTLTLVNDTDFPDLIALVGSRDGKTLLALSPTTDTGYLVDVPTGRVRKVPLGDGPSAAAAIDGAEGRTVFLVGHRYSDALWRLTLAADGAPQPPEILQGFKGTVGLAVDTARQVAFVAEEVGDTVAALDLKARARLLWRTPVAPGPRELALTRDGLAVGSVQAGLVDLLAAGDGKLLGRIQPEPGVAILGGHTERFGAQVMGGKAVRALAYSPATGKLFVSSVGPNVGPNAERMEVTMNGGVGVVDPASKRFERHVGFNAGVPEGLALDDRRGLLYLADIGLGQVRVYRTAALAGTEAEARSALVQVLALPPPAAFPSIRPDVDLAVPTRAGKELHSGPRALVLSPDGNTLHVLNRFTGTLAVVDVTAAAAGKATLARQLPLEDMLVQSERRMGQVLYFTDVGRTGMSCDACHLEGHGEGILFEKTHPMRIYRSTSIRGARETPPYFNPASTSSMAQTSRVVGDRNRFHNPNLSTFEVEAQTIYASSLVTLPNPFVGPDGAPVAELALPDGAHGRPRAGLPLFEAHCVSCHPAPLFTTDQEVATRGRYLGVATPRGLPLRAELQEWVTDHFATPSLLGAWDTFPMLSSGAAGFEVAPDGSVRVKNRSALAEVLETYSGPEHGNAAALSKQEREDLLAYVMSL